MVPVAPNITDITFACTFYMLIIIIIIIISSSSSSSSKHQRVQTVHVNNIHVMIKGWNLCMGLNRRVVDITTHLWVKSEQQGCFIGNYGYE
jgi:hypothetical protein